MPQASWNGITWGFSDKKIRSIDSMKMSRSVQIERNDDKEGEPATQTVAPELATLDMKFTIVSSAGGEDPRSAWADLFWSIGTHAPFYLAGRMLMVPELLLLSVDADDWVFDKDGEAVSVTVSLKFEEYSEDAAGLKNDKGPSINLTPGVQEYNAEASAAALGMSSESMSGYVPENSQMQGW